MDQRQVKDLMIGLSEIPVVDEDSTLFEALLHIGTIRSEHPAGIRCAAALVVDKGENVAGFLEFRRVLTALEPRYSEFAESARARGFPSHIISSQLEKYGLWEDALEGLCKHAGETLIKSIMTIPDGSRITSAEGSINDAVYQMLVSGQDYLFVREGKLLTGIISLSDIVGHICDSVRACRM